MGMIELHQGNLLEAEAEALVNTVNCVGVMGKGIALQFKQAYPENFRQYRRACAKSKVRLGKMFVFATGLLGNPKFIVNFPTKQHWKAKSRIDDIRDGLVDLIDVVRTKGIQSIAVPPLGCGNGGLDWCDVRPLIEAAFAEAPEVRVLIYAPQISPAAAAMPVATRRPTLTRARALYILLIAHYREPGYRLTKLEAQKLAYFLQVAGEPLKLRYVKAKFGPYADNLNHTLLDMEGHYLRGYGDRGGEATIHPVAGAVVEARSLLAESPEALARLDRVSQLIEGFEDAYGLELLASLLWVAREDPEAARDAAVAAERLYAWSARKKKMFPKEHVRQAWLRLKELNWLDNLLTEPEQPSMATSTN
jgi:O-acetyl-ADP-ribose deacetylase (regulator of RNase III)